MSTMERAPAAAIDLQRLYMDEAGRFDLLTAEQEITLAQTIERGRDAWNLASFENRELTTQETTDFLDGLKARETFITANLLLVIHITRPYWRIRPAGEERLEIFQLGNDGLEHAVEKFDWRKGFKFSTYASGWIKQRVTKGLIEQAHMPCPSRMLGEFNLLEFYENFCEDDAGILKESGWSKERLENLRTYRLRNGSISSLDRSLTGGEETSSSYDIIPDETAETVYDNADAIETLQTVLKIAQKVLSPSDYQTYVAVLENTARSGSSNKLAKELGKTVGQLIVIKRQVKAVLVHPSSGIAAYRDPELEWQNDASCQNTPTEIYFPTRGKTTKQAEKFCQDCPVRGECAEFAIVNAIKFGVWGGMSERRRRAVRKARAIARTTVR